ncbi:MAG: hypothetical protein UV00_C0007G0007 [candidate division WWE3 bacterium GW2011_GWF1_42_14]|uniref:Uncharacterized protein n=1 Tax=candidate division WWE3 bacterium GW2011_GWF1_42_14 TaxID=1619138 RepID=A0A0G1AWE8_UNCKA|nr:MAG: hypothetical protein UV00_C0007G0007 [candidate division WWE3 bacterium GW2011_GWF1_42_14]
MGKIKPWWGWPGAGGGSFAPQSNSARYTRIIVLFEPAPLFNQLPSSKKYPAVNAGHFLLAEGVGFEPTCELPHAWFSRPARYDHFATVRSPFLQENPEGQEKSGGYSTAGEMKKIPPGGELSIQKVT